MTVALPVTFRALGTTAVVLTEPAEATTDALEILRAELGAIDVTCSRFRPDAELVALNRQAGRWTAVSPLLFEAILTAVRVCEQTGGAVDPTVGRSVRLLGYDDDFERLDPDGPPLRVTLRPAPGPRAIEMDRVRRRVRVPAGTELDLGATAKALAADSAAHQAARRTGAGVLVGLGGDLSACGPSPAEGWAVRVTDDHNDPGSAPGQTVQIRSGGLATSSTTVRAWRRGGQALHHLVDPATGACAGGPWRTVSVAAATCVDANAAATAALVRGSEALSWLEAAGLPSRLVAWDGAVRTVAGWPSETA